MRRYSISWKLTCFSKQDMVPKTIKGTETDVIEVGQIVVGPLAPDI
ncbi:MAG: hypothetical protein U5J63_00600 [Fodinibius sp.]|nr:hypothetical protein [Fodinibius sp.]